jgi:hypothetical protein
MTPKQIHRWEPTGVTGYPITHPIVGQTDFYEKLKHWLPLVAGDQFAHVFAVVAPWGVGKSRLGYEVVAQVNGASKGWKVRGSNGSLVDAQLFENEVEREKHLALYIRYSQVANRQLNLDNWFAPAVYKALLPLARADFDSSIQHRIAKQAYDRLDAEGFDPGKLAAAMELAANHGDAIYTDTPLATRLCNAAFGVLREYGIEYVIVVLDELETAAERATGGMEAEEARAMDGKSITMLRKAVELLGRKDVEMMSKAVKEEDARARFPWLRFIALCSPAIGDELKEVQSTDRRFEIVDLARNAFSDVSTFVRSLEAEGLLLRPYPPGLVEAAYMMSGANFGWFNVIMAVVDQVLAKVPDGEKPSLAWIFQRAIAIQERIGRYVLDRRSLDEVGLAGSDRDAIADILFRQQPIALSTIGPDMARRLLEARNAHGEPVALRYYRVAWRYQACSRVLVENRFQRLSGTSFWTAPGIPEPIDLERLLDDLATLAVHEPQDPDESTHVLLLPGNLPDFLQLLDLIHPHPAAEETGRTLWMALVGEGGLDEGGATHIGPSVEMLRRLDIRLRKASVGAVLRDPDENEAFTTLQESARPSEQGRGRRVLTGLVRVLDRNWTYDAEPAGLGNDVLAVKTPKSGLVDFMGLFLHPKGLAAFAWVAGDDSLRKLAEAVARDHRTAGRYPVIAVTTDYGLPERFEKSTEPAFQKARESIVVVHLNSAEESALQSVGLPTKEWKGFRLRADGFTTRFAERLNRIRNPIANRVREWRQEVSDGGGIAWPIRPNGTLKPESLDRLVAGWRIVMLDHAGKKLGDVGVTKGLDHALLLQEIERLGQSPAAAPKGYGERDSAHLWVGQGPEAHPEVPPFLLRSIVLRMFRRPGSPLGADDGKGDWFWGFTWDDNRPPDIFREWMSVAVDLGWAQVEESAKKPQYVFVPREALHGDLNAARKWLDDDYPGIVKRLSDLFGPGLIDQWFKPGGGSKYQNAVQRLDEAAHKLAELDALEANPPDDSDLAVAKDWFIRTTRLRLRIRDLIERVFNKKKYDEVPADLDGQMLHLTDEDRPLWERIRQAEHFADAVQLLARRIQKRVLLLGDEMRSRVVDIAWFPINLFIRPLSKIDHIIEASLTGDDPLSTTKRVQHAKPDTLAYFLKELRVADAIEALRGFAREVGIGGRAFEDRVFDEIDGEIMSGFRDLVARYGAARAALDDLANRTLTVESALQDAPSDFTFPPSVTLNDVSGRPALIEGVLQQSLEEDVEDLLERHNEEMNFGRFGPLMREARTKLLEAPERSIKGLEGKVRTLENAITAYRQDLLKDATLRRHRAGLNALRRAKGQNEVALPEMGDLEPRSLREGRIFTDGVAAGWAREGGDALGGTGVTFSDWLQVVEDVKTQKDPGLPTEQIEALVRKGFLRRVYALAPGGA